MIRICNVLGKRLTCLLGAPLRRTATTLDKDVLLYKYENTRFFRYLNLFGASQFIFWLYLSNFATTLRDVPEQKTVEKKQWYESLSFLGENKYRNGMAALFFLIGKQVIQLVAFGHLTTLCFSFQAVVWSVSALGSRGDVCDI